MFLTFAEISPDLKDIILLMIHPEYQQRPSAQELLNHPIVCRYEKKRQFDFLMKKYFYVIFDFKNTFFSWWAKVSLYLNRIFTKTEEKKMNTSRERSRSPPKWSRSSPNFNKSYVSNYLDLYSDDENDNSEMMSPTSTSETPFRYDDVKTRLFQ